MASATGGNSMHSQVKPSTKAEGAMGESQDSKPDLNGRNPDVNAPNPISNLLSSLAVLPSAEQAFSTDPMALSQNGAAFLGILADLQNNIKSIDRLAFACSPQSVINARGPPPLPSSLFKTPLRDRKRVHQAQDQQSQLLNTGLNVKPRLVLVPTVPSELRAEIKAEEAWSSRAQLQTTLDRYHGSTFAQSSEPAISLQVADWQALPPVGLSRSVTSQNKEQRRLSVHLKVDLGRSTGLWGYICFGRRKRRYEGRYQNRERGNELASAKRLRLSTKTDMDENEQGEAMIATRFHLFSEVETDKGQNDLSDFRWIQELCMHLNHLELSLPELLHRLPIYSDIMQESCRLCSSLIKRGVPPVRRAFLPTVDVLDNTEPVADTQQKEDRDQNMEGKVATALSPANQPSTAVPASATAGEEGQWVAFHSACL